MKKSLFFIICIFPLSLQSMYQKQKSYVPTKSLYTPKPYRLWHDRQIKKGILSTVGYVLLVPLIRSILKK